MLRELSTSFFNSFILQWWDARSGRHSVRKAIGPHVCGDALDIEPSTLEILTASWRRDHDNIQCWDFASGKLIKQLQAGDTRSMVSVIVAVV